MQSVKKVINVLEYVIYSPKPVSINQAAKDLNMSVSNVYKYLSELYKCGLLIKSNDKTYTPSLKVVEYSSTILKKISIRGLAHPFLVDLMAKTGQTVHLGIREGSKGVYVDKVEGPNSLPMVSKIGASFDLYSTALGKAMLAFLEDFEINKYLKAVRLVKKAKNTLANQDTLRKDLEEIKKRHFSIDMEENEDGIICIGAPIFDFNGSVIAAVSLSTIANKMDEQLVNEYTYKVLLCAKEISKLAGYKV